MLSNNTIGLALMSLVTLIYGLLPPLVDLLTLTHVFHPHWTPHAYIWLLGVTSAIGLVTLYARWRLPQGRNLAGVLHANC